MKLSDSIRTIKGIGEKAEKLYEKLSIETVEQLLMHYPRGYEKMNAPIKVREVREGDVVAIDACLKIRPTIKRYSRIQVVTTQVGDETGAIAVTWFNMAFLQNQLKLATHYIFRGKVNVKNGRLVMEQPKIYKPEEFIRMQNKLYPQYGLTKGLTNNAVLKAVRYALDESEEQKEFLSSEIRKKYDLCRCQSARKRIHFPKNEQEMREARKRLVFEELFFYTLSLRQLKKGELSRNNHRIMMSEDVRAFQDKLPFTLTDSQENVLQEIMEDMQGETVMNRLVQGDVGSGKTIVAVISFFACVTCGYQGAMMVPTEVLAMQHFQKMKELLKPYSIEVGVLTGSMTAKEKRECYERIADGTVNIVVGTHAVIQDKVHFQKLGLVVTDEQHRFGVRQRENLYKKGDKPHVLAMSATPIPRTLALMLYGDMDLSIINTLPANRRPIHNCVVGTDYRPQAYRFMTQEVEKGRQVYVICPMVEESDETELENVTVYTEEMKKCFAKGIRITMLHGKMKPAEKNRIMEAFSRGEIDILVSTTVIEVGIDVPNATTIMIENAEHFGLATLHQLRGRVGRGQYESYCILMAGTTDEKARKRLQIVAENNDGFYIANEDLKLRGQGDFFGTRQSGEICFQLADIFQDAEILKEASYEASQITEDELEKMCNSNPEMRKMMNKYMGYVSI